MKSLMKATTLGMALALAVVLAGMAHASVGNGGKAVIKTPKVAKKTVVYLVEDGERDGGGGGRWRADPASAFIAVRNLRWNAETLDVICDRALCAVLPKKTGEYVFGIRPERNIVPGARARATVTIRQNGRVYKLGTKIVFKRAPSPFENLTLHGNGTFSTGYHYRLEDKFVGLRTYRFERVNGVEDAVVSVQMAKNQKLGRILVRDRDGSVKTIQNGGKIDLSKTNRICIRYQTIGPEAKYYKAESSAAVRNRFPMDKWACIEVVDVG